MYTEITREYLQGTPRLRQQLRVLEQAVMASPQVQPLLGIYKTRYELDAARLPASLRRLHPDARWVRLGSTTYRSSTWVALTDAAPEEN